MSTINNQRTKIYSKPAKKNMTSRTQNATKTSRTIESRRPIRSTNQSRYRKTEQEELKPINFFKFKLFISIVLVIFIISGDYFTFKIGNYSSESFYDMLYYNENVGELIEKCTNIKTNTIDTFWNEKEEISDDETLEDSSQNEQ